ncbi:unnamed protein product [Tilletia controversa]|uniref:PARP catalytic domain-containing protein n=3 Tax=Tilletia TaxID=13289 RepID=A0A8X7N0X0_9BASI|nr:hypothetical protein CF336_g136 [Tilletia laevis]KAE8206107.1 hypothetical protein CF328_g117 [Tilletia controversa]KAE8265681.1 hypothetical protein A4X03_0g95 [Tilletia caries]KAE8255798.1 hypothetical protein A4X06_0g250 [Tilletia controversa]CAD6899900.1 unnamed protein product [Tilletia caries]
MAIVDEKKHTPKRLKCLLCEERVETMAALCTSCSTIAQLAAPTFVALDPTEQAFRRIKSEFLKNWLHPTNSPKIVAIHAIWMQKSSSDAYEDVRAKNHSQAELRLYHGTKVKCNFGPGATVPCHKMDCYLCQIVKNGFRHPLPNYADPINGKRWDRFGSAMYFSPVSSKAADYERKRNGKHDRIRNVIIARVATGREEVMSRKAPYKEATSNGYDCVYGPAGRAGLNYAEYAVYNDFAALPAFVVSFEGGYPSTG